MKFAPVLSCLCVFLHRLWELVDNFRGGISEMTEMLITINEHLCHGSLDLNYNFVLTLLARAARIQNFPHKRILGC
jgi:hypothetical protein